MRGIGPILRISLGLVLLTSTILIGLDLIGWLPTEQSRTTEMRVHLAETLAAQATSDIERGDLRSVRRILKIAASRNEDLLSAGIRTARGRLVVSVGAHRDAWNPPNEEGSTASHIRVPLYRSGRHEATIELRFDERGEGLAAIWTHPLTRILLWVAVVGFFAYGLYMRRTLRLLDPSAVIPTRVQATLDVMTEGVVVIDPKDSIVMANAAFASRFGMQPGDMMGRKASTLGWRDRTGHEINGPPPWMRAMTDGDTFVGECLTLNRSASERRVLTVNGAPVLDGWGRPTGAIVTFNDVTELERNREELEQTLGELEKSRDEIRLQNEELQTLAQRDPLTGAANRRSFMEDAEVMFRSARQREGELACIMADIDHFKAVNDQYGHQTGDEVIRRVADGLMSQIGGEGLVCRYGGEEFCVALPESTPDEAEALGERVRRQVSSPGFASVPVTVSLGVSSIRGGAGNLSALIDEADQALYAAKDGGRNRVSRFDRMQDADRGGSSR